MIAMAACREELLGQLQRLGCVEIREPETAGEDWSGLLERESSRLAEAKGALAEVNTALAAMRRYGQVKDGLFVKRRLVTEKEFLGGGLEAQAKTVTQDVGERLRTLSGIQTEMSRLQARRAGLLPWQDLDLPLEAEGTEHVLSRLGTCPAGTDVGALRLELEALPAELLEISADKQQRYLLLLCHRAAEEPVMEVLRAHGFSAAAFPGVTGTAAADLKQTDRQLEELQRRREEAEAAIAESARERDTLRTYADRLTAETARESAAERLLTDGTIVFFEGWAPAERMADVSALLERLGCAWEAADPAPEEYPEVPVKLKNNCLTRPLNMVTEMYSLPAYDNVDPNPLMAPFFILFYGVMMADMGYGLLMMLASVFVLRTYRPKGTMQHFFGLLGLCGISTFVMGALTGGFFGDFLTQLGRETEARTVPGRVLGGDHLVGGLRRNRAGSAGGDEPGAVCGHRAGGGRACHQRKGIREDHRDLRLPVQPRDRLFRGHPVLLPADGPDAVRQRHRSGVQHLGRHPRQRGGVLHRLHGGKRPELRAESAGLLRP